MDCTTFWVFIGGGAIIVPLLEFLKKLPKVGPLIDQVGFILQPLLAVLLPLVAQWVGSYCGAIDKNLWTAGMAFVTFLVSHFVYQVAKKAGKIS